ncbi:MAG: hypothetical protein GF311_17120 [Candidatus Lokiarchaeota archaeon]|nr:hypothetical protein [Candidatus Lokiarchaeota archaeon]MBD3340789.1 hypothetical protein [Candidatus Lokiarchaeota archaeon]
MYKARNKFDKTLDSFQSIKNKLSNLKESLSNKNCFLGVDGYVDSLYSIVQKRKDQNEWKRMDSMASFGNLITKVAGSSANIERVLKRKISGGFAPNSCKALIALGIKVFLLAAIGYPKINEVFKLIDQKSVEAKSFADPGETLGLEFDDGKIMLSDFENIFNINWDLLTERINTDYLIDKFEKSQFIGFGHWSLVISMGEIWEHLIEEIFPKVANCQQKLFFVDLADLKKRTNEDILNMLKILKKMDKLIPVLLSLNDQEAVDLLKALEIEEFDGIKSNNFQFYADLGLKLNNKIGLTYLVIHSPHFATITKNKDHYWVTEGFTSKPKYTTGAGDHFHAGVAAGLACDLTPPEAILLGNALTAVFVRTGQSPNWEQLSTFIKNYMHYLEVDDPNFS